MKRKKFNKFVIKLRTYIEFKKFELEVLKRVISELCCKFKEKSNIKAKHLYSKISYIKYVVNKIFKYCILVKNKALDNKELINDTTKYFATLGLYIFAYGLTINLGVYFATRHFFPNSPIPFGMQWIYIFGLVSYLLKEEMPRVIRNCFPRKNGIQ